MVVRTREEIEKMTIEEVKEAFDKMIEENDNPDYSKYSQLLEETNKLIELINSRNSSIN